jgi:hypothetical protein
MAQEEKEKQSHHKHREERDSKGYKSLNLQ